MNTVSISAIIPTFNREVKVLRAIRTVLAQTLSPLEIIVVDDGSTDDTISKIKEEFPDAIAGGLISILPLEHKGVSHARNRGVEQARGEWIAFLDSDDEWLPEKLERQWDFICKNSNVKILQSQEVWIRNGKRVNPPSYLAKKNGEIFEQSLEFCSVTPSSVVLKKELYQETGGMDEELPACEDYDLWLRITSRVPVSLLEERLLIRYGGHEDQLSFQHPVMDRFRIYSILKLLNSHLPNETQRSLSQKILFIKWNVLRQGKVKRHSWNEELDSLFNATLREGLHSSFGMRIKEFLLNPEGWTKF
ncbi:glycosyltransferase family 2 protein [Leptospira barantonii]|uniref:Glycosyltransferase family 2 protein n=1 Tax=Leptospira barantonii TaxID=2023184 RepID=A0A5F2B4Y5_9LEPT|nr:glycosyltransferase family A protein [Leptospira barantonii]TGM00595.1 glycosyltransferase family 2 protein [Leptospira barantonii]